MSVSDPYQPNPYQPPQVAGQRAVPLEPSNKPPLIWGLIIGLPGALTYLAFVVMLVQSTGQDRIAGWILSCNLVLGIGTAVGELIRYRVVWRSYSVLILGQMVIMVGMLASGFGNPTPVITIHTIIIVAAAFLGGMSWIIARGYGHRRAPRVRSAL